MTSSQCTQKQARWGGPSSAPIDVANLLVLGVALQRLRTGTLCALHSLRGAAAAAARQARANPAAAECRMLERVAPLAAALYLRVAQPSRTDRQRALAEGFHCLRPLPTLCNCRYLTMDSSLKEKFRQLGLRMEATPLQKSSKGICNSARILMFHQIGRRAQVLFSLTVPAQQCTLLFQ